MTNFASTIGLGGDSNEHPSAREKGFWVLDWLRFVLAIYLVLFHTLRISYASLDGTWLDAALGLGNFATSVFFVLSGFLLTYAYVVTKKGQPLNRRKFFVARFSTLYPLHIVGLLLALVPALVTIYVRGGISVPVVPSGEPARMLGHSEFMLALLTNVAMLNAWNPFYLSINIPSWSLSALAFFYLVFPIVAPRIYGARSLKLLLVALGVLFLLPGLIADVLHRTDMFTDGLLHRNPVIRLPLFIAGIVLCVLFSRTDENRRAIVAPSLVVAATLVAGIYLQRQGTHFHLVRNGLYFPASIALVWLCVCVAPISAGKMRYWGTRLGAASLPLFFLHAPIYTLFVKTEKLLTALSASPAWSMASINAAMRDIQPSLALFPIYLMALVVLCVLVQERFVIPVQAMIRNRVAGQQPKDLVASKSVSVG